MCTSIYRTFEVPKIKSTRFQRVKSLAAGRARWNVHFWRKGFSSTETGDNRADVLETVRRFDPDMCVDAPPHTSAYAHAHSNPPTRPPDWPTLLSPAVQPRLTSLRVGRLDRSWRPVGVN